MWFNKKEQISKSRFNILLMKKIFTLIAFLSIPLFTQAQEETQKGNGKITGVVIDGDSNQPVEFANIALIDPKTGKPVNGSVADDKGKFSITKISPGTYQVQISFIGYETKNIDNVVLGERKNSIDLGTIKVGSEAKVLGEVVVEGQKQLVEERVDRTIYNAENDKTTAGGDATDVLRRVPLLSVDLDGNVSLRGNSNLRVLINNKPSTIAASSVADALKQIPADQIKSVEVITSPSAKYDAEGSSGIINIITKKNTLQGATLNVDLGTGLRGSNLGLNGSYRKNKMGISLGGFGRAGYNVKGAFENVQNTGEKSTIQQADTRRNDFMGRYQLGWDYDINKNNSITASARFGGRGGNNYQDGLSSETFLNDALTSSSYRNVKTIDNSTNLDVNLDYTRLFEKPQKEFSISSQYSRNDRTNDFYNTIYNSASLEEIISRLKNINKSLNEELTFQFDYQTPLSTKQIIEFGAKNIGRTVTSDFQYLSATGANGEFLPAQNNGQAGNIFNYNQNVTGTYLSYTVNLNKSYSLKAGARYEYTTIDANFQNPSEGTVDDIPSYGVLVPSVNVSKKMKNGNTLKAAYNRRIQRPSIQFLNPNIQNPNPFSETIGNPTLDPEFTDNYELSYSTFIKGSSLNFSTFVRNTTGAIQSIREVVRDSVIRTSYANIGEENAYGGSFFGNLNIGNLSLNGGTDVYYAVLDNNSPDNRLQNEGWVANGRLFGNYKLKKGWGFQFFSFYRGRNVNLQGYQGGFGVYSLGLKKDFNNKRGSIGFGAENFFHTSMKIRSEILPNAGISQKSVNEMRNMNFRFNISYRFGKMSFDNAPRNRRRKSVSNDDLKDGGGDGGGGGMDNAQGGGGQQRGGNMPNIQPQRGNTQVAKPAENTVKTDPTAVVKVEGNWTYTIESPQGGGGSLKITKTGDGYTGIIINSRNNREVALKSVTVTGNELSFSYENSFGGNTMEVLAKGIITGDEFKGTMTVGQFGSFPMNAKRTE